MKKLIGLLGLLFLLSCPCFGQESNPDGIIGKVTIGVYGGVRTGNSELNLFEGSVLLRRDGDFKGSGLWTEVIYPASKSLSLVFKIQAERQQFEYPETFLYYRQESRATIYTFVVGFRFFHQ